MRRRRLFLTLGAAALLCGSALAAEAPGVSYEKDVQPIFRRDCIRCHDAREHKGKLDLSDAVAYKNLVYFPSSEVDGILRVRPGNPEGSYLWLKLQHRAREGSGMPKGFLFSRRLDSKDLDLVEAWIKGGALP